MINRAKQSGETAQECKRQKKPVKIMFMDEARFGRINDPRKCWCPSEIRPVIGSQIIREYIYAYVAVDPFSGSLDCMVLPVVNTDVMSIFLKEVSSSHPDEQVVIIMDQASWHRAKGLKIPTNISLYWLPPYSPELNPVEHIWEEIREKWFHNKMFENLDEVEEQLILALRDLIGSPQLVKSMALFSWMLA